jgi:hypothetical protein
MDIGSVAVSCLALSGLALAHYRILILSVLFFPALLLIGFSRKSFIALLSRISWIGIGSFILFLPWFIQVFGGKILDTFTAQITTSRSVNPSGTDFSMMIGDFRTYLPLYIWILFFFFIAWGLWKRQKNIAIFTLWWLFIILATNPNWIGLPGAGVITNFAVFIAFYIPASVSIASVVELIPRLDHQMNNPDNTNNKTAILMSGLMILIVCVLGIWGVQKRVDDLDTSTYSLVTRPDIRAMDWIRTNTAPQARFLINSFPAYGNTSIVGSDAGWWIPLLALRQNTVPPLTYAAEQGISPDFGQKVMTFYYEIRDNGITSPEALKILKAQGVDHVYIGQRQGRVNYIGPDVLDPQILSKDDHFNLIYHQDRVWIFKINY